MAFLCDTLSEYSVSMIRPAYKSPVYVSQMGYMAVSLGEGKGKGEVLSVD